MKDVDDVRGYQRDILFNPENQYTKGGGVALTNCVVEATDMDYQLNAPSLSLRFYHKPRKSIYNEDTPVGVDLSLSRELAQSLIDQINAKWPELLKIAQEESEESDNEPPE
jgi:hypothetical protein